LKKEQAVMCYLDILNSLLPQDPNLLRPTLSHPDFHNENIFVNPENPSEITAILDWSSAEIAPLLVQAQPLRMIDYEGPQLEG
jgi:aminoglycoside phosphotransferase (APT) family kinase protein